MSNTYEITLPQFEGPFDLLLFFIERDELEISDIPIAKITSDFLEYLHQAQQMNFELAGEFIVVAATLMRIKAKMLIPRKEKDEEGNEIDPRQELVNQLIEYKRYKAVIEEMQMLESERQKLFRRGNIAAEWKTISAQIGGEAELHQLTIFRLVKSFEKVLKRLEEERNKPKHLVVKFNYTLEEERFRIQAMISGKSDLPFGEIFEGCENRIHAIFRFLAMLEMIQHNQLKLRSGMGKNNFWILPVTSILEPVAA